jgi:tetratricopeptide (TPR) repeat protein
MSLKQEIETWVAALGRYDNNEFEDALGEFDKIGDTSKILFNMGVIHATLGEHEQAVECYQRAIRLDQYLAVAYFQQGVSNFLLGDFEEALANFNDTLLYLRGNTMIDYAQLGLLFKLYSCEVLFNRGLCYIYLQQKEAGLQDLNYAVKEKVVEDHNVIDEAIREEAEVHLPRRCHCISCLLTETGIHRLLDPRRRRLPSQRRQGAKPQDQGLPRKGAIGCCLGPCQRLHRLCWV